MTAINNIIRAAIRKSGDRFNILTFGFDGYYENMLAKTGNMIYVIPVHSRYEWKFNLPPKEKDCIILPDVNNLPIDLEIDVILCQDRRVQYDIANQFRHILHSPLVCVEHFYGLPIPNGQQFDGIVAASSKIAEQIDATIIPYSIEKMPTPTKDGSIVSIGEYGNEERGVLSNIKQMIPDFRILGNNPGISPQPKTQKEYDLAIKGASIYINLSIDGRISNHLLKAMAASCVIISNNTPGIAGVLNSENSIMCSSAPAITSAITKIKKNPELAQKLGEAAKQTANELSPANFRNNWNALLEETVNKTRYTRSL